MASTVSICNLALSNLGKQNISDLTEASAEARACNQFYGHVRDLMLQSYPWRFAGKTASMAEVTNDKPGSWLYAYNQPSDCLKIRWLRPTYSLIEPTQVTLQEEAQNDYEVEGSTIYCNLSPAYLRYTWALVDPTKFKSVFVEALAWHITVRLAMPLTRDPKVRAEAYKIAMASQVAAETMDANEVRETSDIDSDLVEARA